MIRHMIRYMIRHFIKTMTNERGMWPILLMLGKALEASKSMAIGLGKGITGIGAGTSPLALGKTVAPALNASAMKLGETAASGFKAGVVGKGVQDLLRSPQRSQQPIQENNIYPEQIQPETQTAAPLSGSRDFEIDPAIIEAYLRKRRR